LRQVSLLTDESAMPLNLNTYRGLDPQALQLQGRRMEVIANNLANADTPNFKAQDFDFQSALAAAGAAAGIGGRSASAASSGNGAVAGPPAVTLGTTEARHLSTQSNADPQVTLQYRVPLAPSLDGNTVDAQLEQAAFAENTVRYQATLTFLSGKFRDLMTAITGS
jgi:flagellar basal-body rod protein FlgB